MNRDDYRERIQRIQKLRNMAPDLGPSLYSDLMQAAFCEVDWHEVAEAFLEE